MVGESSCVSGGVEAEDVHDFGVGERAFLEEEV